jgi:hypothetical protein
MYYITNEIWFKLRGELELRGAHTRATWCSGGGE